MTQCCETCRFCAGLLYPTEEAILFCYRYPRACEVYAEHWCGEWQAKPEADTDEYRDAYSRMMAHGS